MEYYLFDTAKYGLIAAVVVEAAAFVVFMFSQWRYRRPALLAGLVLAGLALLCDYLVETGREQLERLTREVVQAVEDENAAGVVGLLDDEFLLDNGMDKAAAAREINKKLARPIVDNNHISLLKVTAVGRRQGEVEFSVVTRFDPESPYAVVPIIKSKWLFEYVRSGDQQYMLSNIVNLEIGNRQPIDVFKYR